MHWQKTKDNLPKEDQTVIVTVGPGKYWSEAVFRDGKFWLAGEWVEIKPKYWLEIDMRPEAFPE